MGYPFIRKWDQQKTGGWFNNRIDNTHRFINGKFISENELVSKDI